MVLVCVEVGGAGVSVSRCVCFGVRVYVVCLCFRFCVCVLCVVYCVCLSLSVCVYSQEGETREWKGDADFDGLSLRLKRDRECFRAGPWRKKKALVTGSCRRKKRWSSEVLSDMEGCESLDLGDEWRTWHMDNPELESDEAADEWVKKRRKNLWKERDMSSNLVDG